jgi:hypothetical protein
MLSIWLRRLIDPLVGTREGYLSTSSSYKEEEKKRGRCREGSIYRREEALRARDLVSTNSTRISYKMGLITYQNTGCLYYYSGYYGGRDALNS